MSSKVPKEATGNKNDINEDISDFISAPYFVEYLLQKACVTDVSDIHIDPQEKETLIKVRERGSIRVFQKIKKDLHNEVIGRIKILSSLRTDVHNKGQDGRFTFEHFEFGDVEKNTERVDVRVSILPTFYGENCVLRILRPEKSRTNTFDELGMGQDQIKKVFEELERHQGMIILAGPTGCGKTTTIYTMIHALIKAGRSVITIEDPIEYLIPGTRQIQVFNNIEHGNSSEFGFSRALKSILRQDPDVIVIGEIRDTETANLAFQAALTGHLIISSLHAEDCAGVYSRLRDLGVSKELLHSVSLLISQRLVAISENRLGVFEVIQVNSSIKNILFQNSFPEYIRKALKLKNQTLLADSFKCLYEKNNLQTNEKDYKKVGIPHNE